MFQGNPESESSMIAGLSRYLSLSVVKVVFIFSDVLLYLPRSGWFIYQNNRRSWLILTEPPSTEEENLSQLERSSSTEAGRENDRDYLVKDGDLLVVR